jgi:uncharacterized protein
MRRFILIVLAIATVPIVVMAYTSPGKPTGFVNDFTNIINTQDKQAMEAKLQALKEKTSAEVSVVTVSSLENETIETYAVDLFQEWEIGVKGKDNGLLILVAPNNRQARIEVGYGLEGDITDLQAGRIVDNVMIPAFKAGDYSKGINGAVDAVVAVITNSPEATQYLEGTESTNSSQNQPLNSIFSSILTFLFRNIFAVFLILFILFSILAKMLGKTKSWWLGGIIGIAIGIIIGLISGSILAGAFLTVILGVFGFIFDYIVSKNPPKSGGRGDFFTTFLGGGRGGFGGGGSFGGHGGFGGFGGGMSGGGGASGRW